LAAAFAAGADVGAFAVLAALALLAEDALAGAFAVLAADLVLGAMCGHVLSPARAGPAKGAAL
jgi:hypothetical protein